MEIKWHIWIPDVALFRLWKVKHLLFFKCRATGIQLLSHYCFMKLCISEVPISYNKKQLFLCKSAQLWQPHYWLSFLLPETFCMRCLSSWESMRQTPRCERNTETHQSPKTPCNHQQTNHISPLVLPFRLPRCVTKHPNTSVEGSANFMSEATPWNPVYASSKLTSALTPGGSYRKRRCLPRICIRTMGAKRTVLFCN